MNKRPPTTENDRLFATLAGAVLFILLALLLMMSAGWLVLKIILGFLGSVLIMTSLFAPGIFDHESPRPAVSPRAMGLTLTALVALPAAILLWPGADSVAGYSLGVLALVVLVLSLVKPTIYARPSRTWARFAAVLHLVMTPVLLALVYYGCFVPMGLALRVLGKDPLRRKTGSMVASYWIKRRPPGPEPDSIRMQF